MIRYSMEPHAGRSNDGDWSRLDPGSGMDEQRLIIWSPFFHPYIDRVEYCTHSQAIMACECRSESHLVWDFSGIRTW